jgi:Uma2 family endonuclease
MTALPRRSTMSVDEYLQLDRSSIDTRYEYIDGHVIMMAGGTLS